MKNKKEQIEEMAQSVVCSAIVSNAKIDDKVAINLNKFVENMIRIGYRKATEVIDEFVERLKEENEISFRRYGKGIGISTIFRIADEMRQEVK